MNSGRISGVEDAIKAELIEFDFADTDAAMRQLDFLLADGERKAVRAGRIGPLAL